MRSSMNLRCEIEPHDRSVTIRLIGELDIATADGFLAKSDELLAEGYERLVLDLRELTFMDSTGLRAIVTLHRTAASAVLRIVDGPDHVQRLFTITGLRRLLPFAGADDALGEPAV
jgi:anti-sigma B factor antagonist